MAKLLAVALSIGSSGFFWWYMPSDTHRYYERITDLENDLNLQFSQPDLELGWERRALKEAEVMMVKLALSYLHKIHGTEEESAIDSYMTGLTLLSKSDVHLQFKMNAFESFFRSLKIAMYVNGDWFEGEEFDVAIYRYLQDVVTDLDELKRYVKLGDGIQNFTTRHEDIDMKDLSSLKSYCDAYFMIRAATLIKESVQNNLSKNKV